MINTFGASTWRSGHSSFPASQITSETAPATGKISPYGYRLAAIRPSPSLVKSPSGVPPSASTPKTADQPEQNSDKQRRPSGNRTSTEQLPVAAAPLAQMWRNARLLDRLEIADAKIDVAYLHRALFVGVARPGPAGKCRH
jgi:hypothetical protein